MHFPSPCPFFVPNSFVVVDTAIEVIEMEYTPVMAMCREIVVDFFNTFNGKNTDKNAMIELK